MDFDSLQPAAVWRHFATLCRIPRPSGHEAAIREAIASWVTERGLATSIDEAGNLLIRKPASPGYENRPSVILQGHLDMVCQKNAGCDHDFLRDSIKPVLKDGWLQAEHTTLGADNGIGVALALAVLEADNIAHPALEVLLTADEEAGMSGAQGLEPGLLQGKLLINIDTEDWGEFYLGCAGGMDVDVRRELQPQPVPAGLSAVVLTLDGLHGGHSGVDIHLQRGNAIKLLVRALQRLAQAGLDFRLAALSGGTARNALPREAQATLLLAPAAQVLLEETLAAARCEIADELAGVDEGFRLGVASAAVPPDGVVDAQAQRELLAALDAAPHGVRRNSSRVPGVVETSDNLGVLRLTPALFEATFMVRSLRDEGAATLAREIAGLFELAGARAQPRGAYPGWAPNPESPLLALFQQVYAQEFDGEAAVKVIHAGLECGILSAKYPEVDMISFGPDIRGAHAPGERVAVESVGKAWRLLVAVLAAVPAPAGGLPRAFSPVLP